MRALVTGAAGFVGRSMCCALAERGYDVVGLTRDPAFAQRRVGPRQRLAFVAGSIGFPQQVADAAKDCSVIFHAAGLPPGPAPARVLRWLHVAGSENVLRAARHARVTRLVHFSCADVSLHYDDRMHWDEKRALPRAPEGLFAQTKLMAEELMLSASDDALGISALRPALVWGAGDIDGMGRLAAELGSGRFTLYGGGRNVIATTHIDQLVDAAIRASERERARARAYYVTDGEFMEARELYPRLADALGLPPPKLTSSLPLAMLGAQWQRLMGDEGGALLRVLRRGKSALFDMSQAVADLDYQPLPLFDARMAALKAWVGAEGGAEALEKRARPIPVSADVDAQVRAAGGD